MGLSWVGRGVRKCCGMSEGRMEGDDMEGKDATHHGVLEFEGAFAGHHVADGGDSADLD